MKKLLEKLGKEEKQEKSEKQVDHNREDLGVIII